MSTFTNSRFIYRYGLILAILFLFLAGAGKANAQANGCTGVSDDTQGNLTWNPNWCQEFNSTTPAPPDITVWNFDLGSGGFGNNEIEIYCGPPGFPNNPSQCPSTFSTSTSNAYLDGGGHLLLRALDNSGTWTSARLKTQGLENFKFGRIEGRIQLPDTTNQGLWPAFWSLGSNITATPWPACGEADILEVWAPSIFNGPGPAGNRSTLHTTASSSIGVQPNGVFTFPTGQANNTAFHTYGVIWSANMQQYYVDSPLKPYYIATPSDLKSNDTWPFNLNFFLLMNIAVGGTLGGTPSSSTPNPGVMMLDYVRQYLPAAPLTKPTFPLPSSITVKAGATSGNSTTFTPGLAPGTGYVYFACATNAPKASCSVASNDPLNPHVISSSATSAETLTASITTTANSFLLPHVLKPKLPLRLPSLSVAAFLLLLMATLILHALSRAWRPAHARVVILILAGMTIYACGGGASGVTTPPLPNNGTTPGAYTVTVYAFTESNVSDGTNAGADASVVIPVTVN